MLNKPKFMSPSTNMQECTIDVNADKIPFSCIVDGNEAIIAWQIKIYRVNNNVEVLDTEKQTLSTPFFPVDEKNRNVVFTVDLKPYTIETPSFVNISEPYYWTIKFWSNNRGITVTSCEEVFYAYSAPTVLIQCSQDGIDYKDLTDNIVLNSKEYYFKVEYNQNEDIPLKRYGWMLTDIDSGQVLLDTISHNQIYGTEDNIICFYDGFLDTGNYAIQLYIETQNNMTLKTEPIEFSVSYLTTFLTNDFKVEVLKKEPAIILDWKSAIIIGGKMYDDKGNIVSIEDENYFKENYPIIDYTDETPNTSISIPKDYYVVYNSSSDSNLDISEESYLVLSTQLPNDDDRDIFIAEGNNDIGDSIMRKLSFEEGKFIYKLINSDGILIRKEYKPTYSPNEYVWYIITMSPFLGINGDETTFTVIENRAENGLYASETQYPSSSLYPSFGIWTLKDGE